MSDAYASPYGYQLEALIIKQRDTSKAAKGVFVKIERADAPCVEGHALPRPNGILVHHTDVSNTDVQPSYETFIDYRDVRGITEFVGFADKKVRKKK